MNGLVWGKGSVMQGFEPFVESAVCGKFLIYFYTKKYLIDILPKVVIVGFISVY